MATGVSESQAGSHAVEEPSGRVGDRPGLAFREDPLSPLPGVRSLRSLHRELPDVSRDLR